METLLTLLALNFVWMLTFVVTIKILLHRHRRMQDFWDQQAEWSERTFGATCIRGPTGALRHLAKEVDEVLQTPYNLEEYADCLHLVFDAARRAGYTYDQLVGEAHRKLAKNKTRTWGVPSGDQPVEHVRHGQPTS